jgi:hypothetical protein
VGLHGDPDDYGLPEVDVVIPDDARELDRDVIAYRRELRQTRRRERWQRLTRPFTRYGIAAPFIASAVLIALISGVLMTVVSPRPNSPVVQVPPTGPPRLHPGQIGGGLPPGTVVAGGKRIPITGFFTVAGVIMIVPRACGCDTAVRSLTQQAGGQRLQVWLVADGRTGSDAEDVRRLAARGVAIPADDPDRVLSTTYRATGLTAVLIQPDKVVHDVIRGVRTGRDYSADLRAVQTPS